MSTSPKPPLLPVRQKRRFLHQFEKDLKFFKLFFLLVNKSRVIKHMGVLWAKDGPAGQVGLSQVVGTEVALRSPCARYLQCAPDLDPDFCRIVNDNGSHEAESCALSDRAAEKACRESGKTQVYCCHAGLVDIAVPVLSGGQYIATLLCGQILREPPSDAGFDQVRSRLSKLTYIDFRKLETAYWQVPVSSDEDVCNAVQLMEAFAEYLGTSWGRLSDLVLEQSRTLRELQLLRQEFAHLVLDGTLVDRLALRDLTDKLGFSLPPNRVLVVQLEPEERFPSSDASFDVAFTAAMQAVEEISDTQEDLTVAYLRKRGISVFFHDQESRAADSTSRHARALAQRILEAVKRSSGLRVHIGMGGVRDDLRLLVQSYEEACLALAQSQDVVAVYRKPVAPVGELTAFTKSICSSLAARKLAEARDAINALPLLASQRLEQGPGNLGAQRQLLCSTLYSMCFSAKQLGADHAVIDRMLWGMDDELHRACTQLEIHAAYHGFAGQILDEIRKLYCGRRDKLVECACRLIDQSIQSGLHGISSRQAARSLAVSVSHLGRTFKQATGVTFERFVMIRRVDFARQLLLNPALNVSGVAEKCGFADPAYFARVFRQITGCSPKQYLQNPLRSGLRERGQVGKPSGAVA